MNIEETKRAIEVMQAFVDGKTVQLFNGKDSWIEWDNPAWNWELYKYRVKPEPKEIWVNEYVGWNGHGCFTEVQAFDTAHAGAIRKAVHYREVIEE